MLSMMIPWNSFIPAVPFSLHIWTCIFFSFLFFFTKIELHCVFLNLIFLRYFSCQYTWVKCIFNSCIIFHGRNGFNLTLIFPYWYVCFLLVFHYPKGEVNLGEGEKKRYP